MPSRQIADIFHDFRQKAILYHQHYEKQMAADQQLAQYQARIGELGMQKLGLTVAGEDTAELDRRMEELEQRLRKRQAWLGLRPYQCEHCRDTGYVGNDFCLCVRRRIYADYYGGRNLHGPGPTLTNYPLDVLDGTHTVEAMEATAREMTRLGTRVFLELIRTFPNGGRGMLLYGLAGVGKTYLALAGGREAVQQGIDTLFIHAADLHNLYHQQRIAGNVEMYYLETSGLLIIDDLGTEPMTRNVTLEALNHLLEVRWERQLPTVITTNLAELQPRYEERISSRLYDPRRFTFTQLGGVDLRTGLEHKAGHGAEEKPRRRDTPYS